MTTAGIGDAIRLAPALPRAGQHVRFVVLLVGQRLAVDQWRAVVSSIMIRQMKR